MAGGSDYERCNFAGHSGESSSHPCMFRTTPVPPFEGGSPPPPRLLPGSFRARPLRKLTQLLKPCCIRKLARAVAECLAACRAAQSMQLAHSPALFRVLLLRCLLACLCPLPPAAADAIAFSTLLATTKQAAPGQAHCAVLERAAARICREALCARFGRAC